MGTFDQQKKMSWVILVLALAFLGVVWYLTRSEPERPRHRPRDAQRSREEERSPERSHEHIEKPADIQNPNLLLVFDLVTETDEACEHVIWFSRCEGDVYEITINNVPVARGGGAELDVAHAKNYSSTALMTREKIAFPFVVGVNVYRGHELFGRGVCTVRGPGEALPAP